MRNLSHIATHHLLLTAGATDSKNGPRLCHFKSDLDEIWQECSSNKYAAKLKLEESKVRRKSLCKLNHNKYECTTDQELTGAVSPFTRRQHFSV